MLKKTAFYAVPAALALLVGACTTQQPAPVVAGNSGGGSAASSSNPYGATPYEPNAGNNPAESAPYTPPASQSYPAASSGGYIPSNAPVDINAATHTVVRGDTVYNIAKRYQITQDNLRAWNNLSDNNISVGQVLRVKPAGYTPPATAQTPPPATSPRTTPAPVLQENRQPLLDLSHRADDVDSRGQLTFHAAFPRARIDRIVECSRSDRSSAVVDVSTPFTARFCDRHSFALSGMKVWIFSATKRICSERSSQYWAYTRSCSISSATASRSSVQTLSCMS